MAYQSYEYTTFPRKFLAYRWFKPLLVSLLVIAFGIVGSIAIAAAGYVALGGLDGITRALDPNNPLYYNAAGLVLNLGTIAFMLPALVLAALVVRDRPFSSYSSSRGGFKWGTYAKFLLLSLAVTAAFFAIVLAVAPEAPGDGVTKFDVAGYIVFVPLVLLQSAAEEFIYRGLIMQAIGSWTKLPVVGIVVSSVVFALSHTYQPLGLAAVFVDGLALGVITWRTRGLEASCALHGASNIVSLGLTGFGVCAASSGTLMDFVESALLCLIMAGIVFLLARKLDWFKPTGDGLTDFNNATRARMKIKEQARSPNGRTPTVVTHMFLYVIGKESMTLPPLLMNGLTILTLALAVLSIFNSYRYRKGDARRRTFQCVILTTSVGALVLLEVQLFATFGQSLDRGLITSVQTVTAIVAFLILLLFGGSLLVHARVDKNLD